MQEVQPLTKCMLGATSNLQDAEVIRRMHTVSNVVSECFVLNAAPEHNDTLAPLCRDRGSLFAFCALLDMFSSCASKKLNPKLKIGGVRHRCAHQFLLT